MNRNELITMVESYAKRTDLTSEIETFFLPIAEARIGRDLKSAENEVALPIAVAASPFDLPADYGQMRALDNDQVRGPVTMLSLDLHSFNHHKTIGTPGVYTIKAKEVYIAPFTAGDFTMYYWARPALPTGASTNEVLERWPEVYLYAVLVELHIWERDQVQLGLALDVYNGEVQRINRDAERGLGDKPAMRRA